MLRLILPLLIAGAGFAEAKAEEEPSVRPECVVTPAERLANRAKAWSNFDLSADEPKGAMWLSARGCFRAAAEEARDYLAHGKLPPDMRAQTSITFHIARNLARAGDRKGATLAASASRRFDQPADAKLDWNSYVEGFAAYLAGDRSTTERMHAKLVGTPGESNRMNAAVLARILKCFDQPFVVIERDARCAPPSGTRK